MKRNLLLILAILLIAVPLAGCGGGNTDPVDEPGTGDTSPPPADAEPVELIWIMGNPGQVPPDQAMVEEKLNEISVEALNVKVTTLYYDNERTMLALSAGDEWDMVFTCEWFNNFPTQARAGYYADLTTLLPAEAPGLYATMPKIVWEGAKIDGKIMAIPVKKDYAAEIFFVMDKELFETTLGMTVPEEMGFFEIEEYLAAAKKAWEDGVAGAEDAEYPLYVGRGGVGGTNTEFDFIHRGAFLGIPYSATGDDADQIVVTLEHPDMYDRLLAVHDWYKKGYINPDAATLDSAPYSPIWVGQGFYGADAIWTQSGGYVVKISKFSGPNLSTASIRGAMNAINADSPNVELALKFQELVNTNKEYRDILRYGVPGVHFNYQEDGTVMRTEEGRANYMPWAFSQGSYSLSSVEAAEGVEVDPKMWEVIFDGYKDLQATNAIGFAFDITPVEGEIAALQVIQEKYWTGLVTGISDPEVEVPKMIAEMEAAGLREVQAEAQAQFDAFLAGAGN